MIGRHLPPKASSTDCALLPNKDLPPLSSMSTGAIKLVGPPPHSLSLSFWAVRYRFRTKGVYATHEGTHKGGCVGVRMGN